jgi:hypothetical protein
MKFTAWCSSLVLLTGMLATGCRPESSAGGNGGPAAHDLVGQWRAKLQFRSGAFAAIKDLEFAYVFNAGGTMTESSNYDAAPPVPPAYGIWRRVDRSQFEAKYEFYVTKAPARLEDITGGGGWLPAGRGFFLERITISDDGESFTSTIRYEAFDQAGKPVEGGGEAEGRGVRLRF